MLVFLPQAHLEKKARGKEVCFGMAEGACKTAWFYILEVFLEQALQDTSQSSKAQKLVRERTEREDSIEKEKIG